MEHLPNIEVTVQDHKNQLYDTAGDYGEDSVGWWLSISKSSDWRHEGLVLIHELVEMMLTKNDGVKWSDVDDFDIHGEGKGHPDPGSLWNAPYHKQHKQAEQIEKRLAKMLGVNWEEYNDALDAMEYK
jgi:hypothetical protein